MDVISNMLGNRKKVHCPLCGLPANRDEITSAGCPECAYLSELEK